MLKMLREYGFWLDRHGANHDLFTNGTEQIAVPRHSDVNEETAKAIIRKLKNDGLPK